MRPGKEDKQRAKVHSNQRQAKREKRNSLLALPVPGHFFALIMSFIFKSSMFKALNKNGYLMIVSGEREIRKDVISQMGEMRISKRPKPPNKEFWARMQASLFISCNC